MKLYVQNIRTSLESQELKRLLWRYKVKLVESKLKADAHFNDLCRGAKSYSTQPNISNTKMAIFQESGISTWS